MLRAATTLAVGVLAALCACMKPPETSSRASRAQMTVAYTSLPASLCLELDAAVWGRLLRGEERLVLHVQHEQALHPPAPTLTAAIVTRNRERLELEPFSLQADVGSPPPAQHFGFDLRGRVPSRQANEPLCIEIGFFPGEPLERLRGVKVRLRAATESVASQ